MFVEGGVDLAGAEDHAFNLFWRCNVVGGVLGVGDYPLEMGLAGEVFDVRAGKGVAEKGFGEEHYEC